MQMEFVTELFTRCKQEGIHTCLDTSGIIFRRENIEKFNRLMEVTDLVMLDIKHIDDEYGGFDQLDDGGAIYWSYGDYGVVSNCTFINNNGDDGGAICWDYGSHGNISGCTFVNNHSVLFAKSSQLTFTPISSLFYPSVQLIVCLFRF